MSDEKGSIWEDIKGSETQYSSDRMTLARYVSSSDSASILTIFSTIPKNAREIGRADSTSRAAWQNGFVAKSQKRRTLVLQFPAPPYRAFWSAHECVILLGHEGEDLSQLS